MLLVRSGHVTKRLGCQGRQDLIVSRARTALLPLVIAQCVMGDFGSHGVVGLLSACAFSQACPDGEL